MATTAHTNHIKKIYMKQSKIALRSILACAAMALIASCGEKETTAATTEVVAENDAPTGCRIAYFEADSVFQHYTLAQQLNEESQRMMLQLQQQAAAKQRDLEQKAANIENKRQRNIYLSEASFQHDVEEYQRAQAEAERVLNARQAQVQEAMAASQQRLTDSIRNCVNELNQTLGYDAILLAESGIYFKPELNITNQIIEALNARYAAPAAGR